MFSKSPAEYMTKWYFDGKVTSIVAFSDGKICWEQLVSPENPSWLWNLKKRHFLSLEIRVEVAPDHHPLYPNTFWKSGYALLKIAGGILSMSTVWKKIRWKIQLLPFLLLSGQISVMMYLILVVMLMNQTNN